MGAREPIGLGILGTFRRGEQLITGTITVTAAGAIASVSCEQAPGTTGTLASSRSNYGFCVKNAAAGRYDLAFFRKFRNLRYLGGGIMKAGGGAFGNAAANTIQPRVATTNADATLQAFLASTGADTDVASGDIIHFAFAGQLR
jgi:hypothetical protein